MGGFKLSYCTIDGDKFSNLNGNFSFEISNSDYVDSSLSISDCMLRCWNKCSCVRFQTYGNNGTERISQ